MLIDQHSVPTQGTKAYLEVSTATTCSGTPLAHALSHAVAVSHALSLTHACTCAHGRSFGTTYLSSSSGSGRCASDWRLRHLCCTSCACGAHGCYTTTRPHSKTTSSVVSAMRTSPSLCIRWLCSSSELRQHCLPGLLSTVCIAAVTNGRTHAPTHCMHRCRTQHVRCFRDHAPHLPCALDEAGSDCCELVFSELCGCGASATMERNYTHHDAQHCVPKQWRTQSHFCRPQAPLHRRRHEKLCTIWDQVC